MDGPHVIVARVYEHIEPIDRGERYADPLDAMLTARGLGRVTGGGTQMNEEGGVDYADLEIEVADVESTLPVITEALEAAGAPEGSEAIDPSTGQVLRQFGRHQCLAVYLDGQTLPDEVYAELDFAAVVAEIGAAAGDNSFHGFAGSETETGLFFFGPDAEAMFARVEPVLLKVPIGQNARVVIRHGRQSRDPREVRIPRR